jgi:hypothetical protein
VPGYHPSVTSATPTRAGLITTAGASAALAASDIGQRVGLSGKKFWFAALRGQTAARELAPSPHAAAPSAIAHVTPCVGLPAKSFPAKFPPANWTLSAVARGVSKPSSGAGIFATLQRPVLGGAAALSRAAVLPGAMAKPFSRLALTEMLQRSAPPPQGAPPPRGAPQAVSASLLQQRVPQAKGAPPPPRALEMMPGLQSSESLELNHEAPPLQLPITRPVTQLPALPSTPAPESSYSVMSASPDNVSPLLLKPSAPRHALHLKPLRFAPAQERTDKLKCFCVGDADGAAPPPHSKRRTTCAPSAVGEGGSENGGRAGAEEASPRAAKRACLGRTVSFISIP